MLLRRIDAIEDRLVNISLTPQLEGFVKQKVSTGLYNSSSEVIREGLRLLEERDTMKNIKLEVLRIKFCTRDIGFLSKHLPILCLRIKRLRFTVPTQ